MFEAPAIAKYGVCLLLAAYSFVPFARSRTCTGPNCQNGQCTRQATVILGGIPVTESPEIYTDVVGDRWVLVEEPVAEGEPEDFVSPIAEEASDVKAEVEADATSEDADDKANPEPEATVAKTADSKPAKAAAKTRQVWMRASDAAQAGLRPVATQTRAASYGSSGSGYGYSFQQTTPVTYTTSYGCTGSGMVAYYGQSQPACNACTSAYYHASSPTYRTRRVLFPNLFPRLRGLR
jgi:hypothetical protein